MIEGFPPSALVIVNLVNPKEKFWGHLVTLSQAGMTLRGINLDTFEDWVRQVAHGGEQEQTIDLVLMFVPLFRVERIFLDESVGSVPSFAEYFQDRVGQSAHSFLGLTSQEDS